MSSPIAIPPKTQARLAELVTAGQSIQGQIDGIVMALREAQNVPDNYQLRDVRIGFEPPTEGRQLETMGTITADDVSRALAQEIPA